MRDNPNGRFCFRDFGNGGSTKAPQTCPRRHIWIERQSFNQKFLIVPVSQICKPCRSLMYTFIYQWTMRLTTMLLGNDRRLHKIYNA